MNVAAICAHGRNNSIAGLLEVVPVEGGETITLKTSVAGCGKPPEWEITGAYASQKTGSAVTFIARPWMYQVIPAARWLAGVAPQRYRVVASTTCGGKSSSIDVAVYPSDKLSFSFPEGAENPEKKHPWRDIPELFKRKLGEYAYDLDYEWLKGKFKVEGQWKEEEKTHLAYYGFEASAEFAPLIGIKGRVRLRPAAFTAVLSKLGDAYLFLSASGGFDLHGTIACRARHHVIGRVAGTGKVDVQIGADVNLMSSHILKAEVAAGCTIKGEAEVEAEPAGNEPPTLSLSIGWEGLKGEISVEGIFGMIKTKHEFTIVKGGDWGKKTYPLVS
jgi:hypothetical protein